MGGHARVAIIGAGGFAREVLDIYDAQRAAGASVEVVGYLVGSRYADAGTLVNDLPILGGMDWLDDEVDNVAVICGVGAPEVRRRLVLEAADRGAQFTNAIHPTVVMSRLVKVGVGVVIGAGSILTNQIQLGNHVHVNLACTVGHDVQIADFVTVSPGTNLSGNVVVGEGAYVGTGVSVIEKMRIGEWAVIGAGAVVTTDIEANSTAVGVPARIVKSRPAGWHLRP